MDVGYFWLIPISIFLNTSLYWVQKHYLIKWFCRKFLSKSVQLECDLKAKQSIANGASQSNGVVANGVGHHEKGTYYGRKLVTDGEVNGIAME